MEGIAPPIGTVDNAYDNGLMDCLIGLYKAECIGPTLVCSGPEKTIADLEYATMAWANWYDNRTSPPESSFVTGAPRHM